MFEKIKQSKFVIKEIFKKDNYLILFLVVSIIIFIIFYFLTLATTTDQSLSIFIMMNGFWYMLSTFFLLGIAAVLFGLYVMLLIFKIKNKTKNLKRKVSGLFGASGLITGLFSAGCPMCGGFLFGIFGAPLALFFLPFKGLELRVLAILLLSLSVYLISRSLVECHINLKSK